MNYFFTSDQHYGHSNIIKYCKRPFKDVDEMNGYIIKKHNERVKPEDIVFVVGDFMFRNSAGGKKGEGLTHKKDYYLNQLNGKLIFISGNHDGNNSLKTPIESLVIKIGNERINLVHNPKHFNKNYKINFIGHIHNEYKIKEVDGTILYNVGVDVNKFMPVTYHEIIKNINDWKKSKKAI